MYVIKRDGRQAPLDISQVNKQIYPAAEGLKYVNPDEVKEDVLVSISSGMTTKDVQKTLIDIARDKVDIAHPDYTYFAARLLLYSMYHEVKRNYNKVGDGEVYSKVTLHDYFKRNLKDKLSKKEKTVLSELFLKYNDVDIENMQKEIDYKRDLLMDYGSVNMFATRYGLKDNNERIELPQHMHASIAMFFAQDEKNPIYWAKQYYDMYSKFEFINSTPTNSNFRIRKSSNISCLVGHIPDNIDGIYDMLKEVAKGSQLGSGWGLDWTLVRSKGSYIDNDKGVAGGKATFLKTYADTARAVNQRGKRPGAFAVFLSTWDIDAWDAIENIKKSADPTIAIDMLFLAFNVDDVFMTREENDETYTLFDPYDVPELSELYGEAFKIRYEEYEKEFQESPERFNEFTKVVKAKDLMRRIIISYHDEGKPFLHFIDTTNRKHKFPQLGKIRSLNLCMEIAQPVDAENTAVCNLGSVNLVKVNKEEDLRRVARLALRALDAGIDLTLYPSEKAKKTQLDRRSVGIGFLGEAEYIAQSGIEYGSDEHIAEIERIYSTVEDELEKYTQELAKEKGSCIIPGRRNAYLMAVAPNSGSGTFASTTNSHEPVFDTEWLEEAGNSTIKLTAPNITPDNYKYYSTAYNMDQFKLMDLTSVRYKHIDQLISHNIFLKPEGLKASKIRDLIHHAWKIGLGSTYYLRSEPPAANQIKSDTVACCSCNN